MGKLTQKVINKQIGKGRFRQPEKCCGSISTIQRIITQGIPVDNGDGVTLRCWSWEYAMTDPSDALDFISLDDVAGNTALLNLSEPFTDSAYQIYETIVLAFQAYPLQIQAANVIKTPLGGGLFAIQILLYGLPYFNLIAQSGGVAKAFIDITCNADYIQDNNDLNILDSLGLPLIST